MRTKCFFVERNSVISNLSSNQGSTYGITYGTRTLFCRTFTVR